MPGQETKVEVSLEQVNQVWRLWDEVGKVGRRRKIAEKTGLPLATVRAVLFGQYEVRNGMAIVRVPIADHPTEIGAKVVAQRVRGSTGTYQAKGGSNYGTK